MVDRKNVIRECDVPKCPTPEHDVKRIESTLEGEGTVIMDLCVLHRAPIVELRKYAHKRGPRRAARVRIVDPRNIPRTR